MSTSSISYMTPQAFTEQYGAQLRKALPNLVDLPIVKLRMHTAMANGLNWSDGFAYALEQRRVISTLRTQVHAADGAAVSGEHSSHAERQPR